MLFQRIFNWIKYKTLPSSFLFRNRLFVERDSKHRRIFSNFGSHFKGSKWSFYLSYSIKTLFKDKYAKYTIKFLIYALAFTAFFFYNKYYIKMPILNSFFYVIWSCADCSYYYLTFVSWWIFVGFVNINNFFFSGFTFNNFSRKSSSSFLKRPFSDFDLPEESAYKKKLISREDIDYYSNLWVNTTKILPQKIIVGEMFSQNTKSADWLKKYNFFKFNFLFTDFTNKINDQIVSYRVNRKLNKILQENCAGDYKKLDQYISQTDLYQNHLVTCLLFFFKKETYFDKASKRFNSTRHLDQKNNWNLYSISNQQKRAPLGRRNKLGSFFFKQSTQKEILDFIMNSDEFKTAESDIKNNLKGSKFQRWLYRYSVLHRKSLKFTNKILAGKKNSSRAAYLSSFYNKNFWKNINETPAKTSFAYSVTSNIDKNNQINFFNFNSFPQNEKRESQTASFYESSYLWLMKKFYFFNYSRSNAVKTIFSKPTDTFLVGLTAKQKNFKVHLYLLQNLNRSALSALNLYDLSSDFDDYDSVEIKLTGIIQKSVFFKDFYISFTDSTLLNNETLRNSLISYSALNEQNSRMFTNYVIDQETFELEEVNKPVFLTNDGGFEFFMEYYMYNEKNIDKFFSEDLIDYIDSLPRNK